VVEIFFEVFLEAQVLDAAAVAADQAQGLDADPDVRLDVFFGHAAVAAGGLDAFGDHRLVRYQQQRAAGNAVGEAGGEDGGRFHVHGHAARLPQVALEFGVVFPHAAVGGVDGAGPVVVAEVADHGGYAALQLERRQGRHV